ncbi:MAG TPA: glycosyltransferase [Bacilli bacterium]|nr:glycosyltransferase [Bacilli bacterium]
MPITNQQNQKRRVLIGSPIHQKPLVLQEFLQSLEELSRDRVEIDFHFIDDNSNGASRDLLEQFQSRQGSVKIERSGVETEAYVTNETTHIWGEARTWKVANFKNQIIQHAIEQQYDYLFLIDSDLVIHPDTIEHLIGLEKDIVSEIFWTKWQPNSAEFPQVWLFDHYTQYFHRRGEQVSQEEQLRRIQQFHNQLRVPGLYEIGGLGACTLISRAALEKGVNFKEIPNVTYIGEDRHFCIRAAALGLSLYVDTHYPAYHIYRDSDLQGVGAYKAANRHRAEDNEKLRLMYAVKEGMEALGTFSYDQGYPRAWQPYFADPLKETLIQQALQDVDQNVQNSLLVQASVQQIQIIAFEGTQAVTRFVLTNEGRERSQSFKEDFRVEAVLRRNEQGAWQISSFEILEQIMPFVRKTKSQGNKITLSMIVKNEADRYLRDVLESVREIVDEAVIIDDGSDDGTVALIKEVLAGFPYTLIENDKSKFSNEVELRKQQWAETVKTNPDWILSLDADEILEKKARTEIRALVNQPDIDVWGFRLYDFWDEEHYREDQYWCAHLYHKPFLVRYQEGYDYRWKETAQHCGRIPENTTELPAGKSDLRVKHMGWSKAAERVFKYKRYQQLDPDAKYGWKEQYESILDANPRLVRWEEEEGRAELDEA